MVTFLAMQVRMQPRSYWLGDQLTGVVRCIPLPCFTQP